MAKTKTELNDFVASFRIPKTLKKEIEDWLIVHPVTGCESANQYLRKLAIDRFSKPPLLNYANPNDDLASPEIAAIKLRLQVFQSPAVAG